jgi:hypothetical protein
MKDVVSDSGKKAARVTSPGKLWRSMLRPYKQFANAHRAKITFLCS